MTTLTHAQIANAVQIVDAAITKTGTDYVAQNYPFFAGMAARIIATIAHQASVAVVNDLVLKKVIP